MAARQTYAIAEIAAMLADRADEVADTYAPPAAGSYTDKGLYWTLNPGRADRSVGSFCIHLSGPRAGKWHDFATGDHGDLIDLIRLSLGCDARAALAEARAWLGLETEGPEDRARREAAAEARKRRRAEAEAAERRDRDKAARQAQAIWLAAQALTGSTPVDLYLRARGIDLRCLPRPLRAIRYLPDCHYEHTDPKTGEVIEGRWPAMVAAMVDGRGRTVAVHRTWLAYDPARAIWGKAPVPRAKKIRGPFRGASIHLWRGTVPGPRGGEPGPLSQAPDGSRVYIAEGIENALSGLLLLPEARVLAAGSLSNFGQVELPRSVSEVVLIADNDPPDPEPGKGPRAQLERAIAMHAAAGRTVRVWRPKHHKDLNDALRAQQMEERDEQRQRSG